MLVSIPSSISTVSFVTHLQMEDRISYTEWGLSLLVA
jgi:hypothetical protein